MPANSSSIDTGCDCGIRAASFEIALPRLSDNNKCFDKFNSKNKDRIDRIFQYTIDNFQEPVTLNAVAAHGRMSVPAFCNYFKKSTKKTYIDFLNEVRIGHACKLLNNTQKSVENICYESGYNTIANFNKQFLKVKNCTPSVYRKEFMKRDRI